MAIRVSFRVGAAALAGVLWAGLAAGEGAASDRATTPTLTIAAVDYDGAPVKGVEFAVRDARVLSRVKTDAAGVARAQLTRRTARATVRLADARWQSPEPVQLSTVARRALDFRVFHRDTKSMSGDERRALAPLMGEVIVRGEKPKSGTPPMRTQFASMLAGLRRESSKGIASDDAPTTNSAKLLVHAISQFGEPVTGQTVSLYMLDEKFWVVRLAGTERTDRAGEATFAGLEAGRLYRAELETDAGEVARTTFFRPKPKESMEAVKPLVPRRRGELLSGVVCNGENPVVGALVSASGEGQPSLSAVTDNYGFFAIAPLRDGAATLRIAKAGATRAIEASMEVRVGDDELLVPVELLLEPEAKK